MTPDLPLPFYFVRHGVTDHNEARLVMGQRDVPLNAHGRKQARRAAAALVGRGVRAVFASPLLRAFETATIIATVLDLPVAVVGDLKERHWGIYEGRHRSHRPHDADPEGGETLADFTSRTLAALTGLAGPKPLLVVAHNGTCRVLRRHFGLAGAEAIVPNATPLYYERADTGWRESALPPSAG